MNQCLLCFQTIFPVAHLCGTCHKMKLIVPSAQATVGTGIGVRQGIAGPQLSEERIGYIFLKTGKGNNYNQKCAAQHDTDRKLVSQPKQSRQEMFMSLSSPFHIYIEPYQVLH